MSHSIFAASPRTLARQEEVARQSQAFNEMLLRRLDELDAADDAVPSDPAPEPAVKRQRAAAASSGAKSKKQAVEAARNVVPPPRFDATVPLRVHAVYPQAKQMAAMLARMGTLGENITLDFAPSASDDGLTIVQMHPLSTIYGELRIPRNAFTRYEVPRATPYKLHYEQVNMFEQTAKDEHVVEFLDASPHQFRDRLCGRLYSPASDRMAMFNVIETANAPDDLTVPFRQWSYPVAVVLDAKTFRDEMTVCKKNKASTVEFSVDLVTHRLSFISSSSSSADASALDQMFESSVAVESIAVNRDVDTAIVPQRFATSFLMIVAGFAAVAQRIVLRFGVESQPLWCHFDADAGADAGASAPTIDIILGAKL